MSDPNRPPAPIPSGLLSSVRDARGHQRLYGFNEDRYVLVLDLIDEIERLRAEIDRKWEDLQKREEK